MVEVKIEVEALTALELVAALQALAYYQDDRHFIVLREIGFTDDDGVRPRWGASLTQHMPNVVDAVVAAIHDQATARSIPSPGA
jgi:hypothetical protein